MKDSYKGKKKGDKHFVYILRCSDRSLYTGWTTDLQRRLEEHNLGEGAKYTRGRGPVEMVYSEEFEKRSDALKRECQIKKYSKIKKEKLIRDNSSKG